MAASATATGSGAPHLRRAVTTWGSYSWGYADIGADIYVALGLVVGAAMGAANIAFAFAGLVYVCIGLAYTELAAAYPVAGGGQFFVTRALGDFVGFVAGWAVLLDFTIDITLFAVFAIGYISALVPWLGDPHHKLTYFFLTLGIIALLTYLNIRGVRESSRLNEVVAVADVINESLILFCGFLFAWHPQILVHTMSAHWPTPGQLLLGTSLAIISFVGLESISQAAEETHRPSSIVPRTSIGLILTILIFAIAYSNLVLGMQASTDHGIVPMFQYVGSDANKDHAVAALAATIPIVGTFFALYLPILAALLVTISSNSGVFGASRIAYSMGQNQLLPAWFQKVSRKSKTPVGTILIFSGVAVVWLLWAFFQQEQALNFLADLYAFGASLSYTLVFCALITLRYTDTAAPRRFKMPLNFRLTVAGHRGDISIFAIAGLLGIFAILTFTLITHPVGRIAGPAWVLLGILLFVIYRWRSDRPVFGSVKRDWVKHHETVLAHAGELEMLDEYRRNLKEEKSAKPA
jgi:APA family basic amino acid/polyamine antiporter